MICLGIVLLTYFGYAGGPLPWFDVMPFSMVVAGVLISSLVPGLERNPV